MCDLTNSTLHIQVMNTSTWNLSQHYPAVIGIKVIVLAPPCVCSMLVSRTYVYVVSFMFVLFVNCMWALVLLRWVDVKTVNIILMHLNYTKEQYFANLAM